ncbi:hypothetical protein [Isoptericola sediminis]|uniref:Uncharacterized protein n=1 Tax=Isoptericola sediminis TaxID=2733572 RepID=A0A849JZI5_9MICO|nr:hypothetical protein [Isoptericola sediminis]NNU27964.1 hypothetical protein [Isoptericola sediminis]
MEVMTTVATLLAGVAAIAAPILALLSRAWSGEFSARKLHRLQRLATLRATLAEQGQATGVLDERIAEEIRQIQRETVLERDNHLRQKLWKKAPGRRFVSGLLVGVGIASALLGCIYFIVSIFEGPATGPQDLGASDFLVSGAVFVALGLITIIPTVRWRARVLDRLLSTHLAKTAEGYEVP